MNKIQAFTTDTVNVVWSHLHAPDDKFGADSANHNITIQVDDDLKEQLDNMVSSANATKINGFKVDDEGRTLLKVKSKAFVKKGVHTFPCRDASTNRTDAVPFGGDTVRLRLSPAVLSRDNSLSFYLNGVQIITKEIRDTGGFEQTDGFDGSNFVQPVEKSNEDQEAPAEPAGSDIPF
tara:strand:- start:1666 stop:2199 length:534 start_codon:yes stop_codon:yes gene_type:complete